MPAPLNLASLLDIHARSRASHPAVIHHGETISYAAFAAEVRRQASHLTALGMGPGDLVGVSLTDSPQYLAILFALARIGAVTLPMDARWSDAERNRLAAFFAPPVVLADTVFDAPPGTRVFAIDQDWTEAVARAGTDAPLSEAPGQGLLVSLSSGTTGRPTGPLLTHEQMFARIVSQMVSLGFSGYDRFMTATPLYFGGGRSFSVAQLVMGATLVLNPPPYPAGALAQAVADSGTTALFLVPTMLRRLLELPDAELRGFSGLRQLISSGAPLHPHERAAVRARLTPNYYEYYASTEGGGISVLPPAAQADHPASVGRPCFRVEVEVVDAAHTPVATGETGAVRYRGPGVAAGFFRDTEASAAAFRDGWFYPGDLGAFDADGYLTLRGRSKDMINRAGVNIYPLEIEQVVATVPGLAEACVFPVPSPAFGEEVGLAFVCAPGAGEAALRLALEARCRDELASYKRPAHVFALAALPRNSGGKVVRSEVVRLCLGGAETRTGAG